GRGEDERDALLKDEKNPEEFRTVYTKELAGFNVRANAAIALARRGSPKARLDLLEELLDPDKLRSVHRIRHKKTGEEKVNEALVAETELNALKALVKLHERQPGLDYTGCREAVKKHTQDKIAAVQKEAQEAEKALQPSE